MKENEKELEEYDDDDDEEDKEEDDRWRIPMPRLGGFKNIYD